MLLFSFLSIMMGLRFLEICAVSVILVAYYGLSTLIESSVPVVIFFVFFSGCIYTYQSLFTDLLRRTTFLDRVNRDLEEKTSADLLVSLLPPVVIREIRDQKDLIAHSFQDVSVLFCDIVSFTTLSHRLKSEKLVTLLNDLFSRFDDLSSEYDVYKVETIGDAYVACAGVVEADPFHAETLTHFALAMVAAVAELPKLPGEEHGINVRVGIHSGPIIAGVVGKKMPRYHLFGETYTIAESVEAQGKSGNVLVSGATWSKLNGFIEGESMPSISVGGAELKVHLVQRHQEDNHVPKRVATRRSLVLQVGTTPVSGRTQAGETKAAISPLVLGSFNGPQAEMALPNLPSDPEPTSGDPLPNFGQSPVSDSSVAKPVAVSPLTLEPAKSPPSN